MEVDYNDNRLLEVEEDKAASLDSVNTTYDSMINQSDQYYQAQIDATKEYEKTQAEIQKQNTEFAIEQIGQQKEQTEKDYTKEQTASYTDYQKESNQYGVNAEALASSGLTNSGYSESSQVAMYTAYQNRVASARQSYSQAVLNYDNAIKEAQLTNNSTLAEIAYNSLQTQLQLSLQGFEYKNQLILNRVDAINQTEDRYYARYQDVLNQINYEKELAEKIRQYEEQAAESKRQWQAEHQLKMEQIRLQIQEANQAQANWEREYAATYGSAEITKDEPKQEEQKITETKKTETPKVGAVINKTTSSSKTSNAYSQALKHLQSIGLTSSNKITKQQRLKANAAKKNEIKFYLAANGPSGNKKLTAAEVTKLYNAFFN